MARRRVVFCAHSLASNGRHGVLFISRPLHERKINPKHHVEQVAVGNGSKAIRLNAIQGPAQQEVITASSNLSRVVINA